MNTNLAIGERVRHIREHEKNMSVAAFARLLDEKDHRIRDIESGKQKIPPEIITKLRNILNINPDWLLTGEGDIYRGATNIQKNKAENIGTVAQSMTINSHITQTGIKNNTRLEKAKELLNNIENNHKVDVVNVPFYEDIYASAGAGAYNETITPTNNLIFSKSFLKTILNLVEYNGLHIITAVGDSMQPTILDGDRLFVLPLRDHNIKDGGVYVISTPFGVLVKRVYIYPVEQKIILHSDNPEIKDEVLQGEIMEKIKFIGRVVGILRNRI